MSAAGYDNLQLRGKYGTEKYWPEKKLKICVTGAGGFIASHLAKRLKEEGHHVVGCDWKRNEHMPVRSPDRTRVSRIFPPRDGAASFASVTPRRRCALCLFGASAGRIKRSKRRRRPSRPILALRTPPTLADRPPPPPRPLAFDPRRRCSATSSSSRISACSRTARRCSRAAITASTSPRTWALWGFIQSNHSVIFYNNIMISFNMMEACRVEGITRVFYASSACIYPEGAQLTTELSAGLKEPMRGRRSPRTRTA